MSGAAEARELEERLREAAALGDVAEVRRLLGAGVDIDSRNEINGWTCLHWACKRNHAQVVSCLLEAGADKHILTAKGELAAQLTSKPDIRKILGEEQTECQGAKDLNLPIVANYSAQPPFPNVYSEESIPGSLAESQSESASISSASQSETSPCPSAPEAESICTAVSCSSDDESVPAASPAARPVPAASSAAPAPAESPAARPVPAASPAATAPAASPAARPAPAASPAAPAASSAATAPATSPAAPAASPAARPVPAASSAATAPAESPAATPVPAASSAARPVPAPSPAARPVPAASPAVPAASPAATAPAASPAIPAASPAARPVPAASPAVPAASPAATAPAASPAATAPEPPVTTASAGASPALPPGPACPPAIAPSLGLCSPALTGQALPLQPDSSPSGPASAFQPFFFTGTFPYNMQELVLKVRVQNPRDNDFIEIELDRQELTYQDLLRVSCCELGINPEQVEKIRKLPNTLVRKDKDVARLQDFQELELVLTRSESSPLRNAAAALTERPCYNSRASKLTY